MAKVFIAPDNILRLPEVRRKVGMGTTSIYKQIAAHAFPKPIPLGARMSGWSENELDAWIAKRKSERTQAA